MSGVNRAFIIGRCGQEPSIKFSSNGNAMCSISIATSEDWKDKNGEKQQRTEWHKVQFFGKQAELVNQYVKKGSLLFVEGKLQTRSWDKDGQKHYSTEIVASNIQFLSSKSESKETVSKEITGDAGLVFPNSVAVNEEYTNESLPF